MAKFISTVLLVVAVAVYATEAARLKNFKQSKFSARQEVDPEQDVAAVTPYPPAGIVPEVRFDLPNEPAPVVPSTVEDPEKTYLPPDNLLPPAETYGPPAQTYGPPEEEAPEGSGNDAPSADEDSQVQADDEEQVDEAAEEDPEADEVVNPQFERFALAKNFRRQIIKPAKLRTAKLQALPVAALRPRAERLVAQPIYATNGALIAYRMLRV